MVADDNKHPDGLPAPDPALQLFCAFLVAWGPELKPKARERVFRRLTLLLDPTKPQVVHIRPRSQQEAVNAMRRLTAAYWRAVEPEIRRLVELGDRAI